MVSQAGPEGVGTVCLLIHTRAPGHRAGWPVLLSQAGRSDLQASSSCHWGVISVKDEVGFAGPYLCFVCWAFLTSEPTAWPGAAIQPKLNNGSGFMLGLKSSTLGILEAEQRVQALQKFVECACGRGASSVQEPQRRPCNGKNYFWWCWCRAERPVGLALCTSQTRAWSGLWPQVGAKSEDSPFQR